MQTGKFIRVTSFLERAKPLIICPVDDALIFGPRNGLETPDNKITQIAAGAPDAILTFCGSIMRLPAVFAKVPGIANLSASTVRSIHTSKVPIHSVEYAVSVGAAACAYHINLFSKDASNMIRDASRVIEKAARFGIPVLGIIYPRGEGLRGDEDFEALKESEPIRYAEYVAHCVAVGRDLGFDLIKTKFTGDADTFRLVTQVAPSLPIVIAGGPLQSEDTASAMAVEAIRGGAAGVSFGRNIFGRHDPASFIVRLRTEMARALSNFSS